MSAHENDDAPETVPRFEAINRQQLVLRPVDIEELIEPHHPARNIWEFLGELDLSAFAAEVKSVEGHAGRSAWEPRLLISLWLYAYSRGISSAREIERQCQYEPGLQWLTGLQVVNHHTLSDFRVQRGEALKQLFVQVLGILHLKKLISLERVTQDGTKVRANVNKKTFTRESKIRAHLQLAARQVQEMEAAEEQEKRTRQVAAKKRAQRERQEQLRQALEEVQRLQQQKKWEKKKSCQASVTDADAQFMRTGDHGLAPCYNLQLTTDAVHGLIVGVGVSKDPSDATHLMPAMERVKQTLGRYPQQVVADGDYTNRESVIAAAEQGVDFYGSWSVIDGKPGHGIEPEFHPRMFTYDELRNEFICPQGKRLSYRTTQRGPGGAEDHVFVARKQDCLACPKRAQCTPNNRMQKHGRALRVRLEDVGWSGSSTRWARRRPRPFTGSGRG